ncbi:hypothetical protein HELRODRAFT_162803 [Helobdella robusta]|uniref:Uncharacterized protein n=1 Tax=Helobdella robusta TaxID=6412 RepID=T1ET66_HELRO|nr:hypothetical protein HELRODRAFT_162803 [Helobdella robusta]ESN99284.1 hypothetical protein HELRODRAFT_162803 [Helobdella robusta]
MFDRFKVEGSLRAELLISKLDAKMRNVLNEIDKDDLQNYEILSLLVADRMKELLPKNLLDHILTREGEEWFTLDRMADILERYEANMNMTCSTYLTAGYKTRPMTDQGSMNKK